MSDEMKERLRRIRQSREGTPAEGQTARPEEGDEGDDPAPLGAPVSRASAGRWPEVSLRLRFQNGKQRAIPYFMLQDLLFDPEEGLVLVYAHLQVRITGRNLAPLFDRLADHKVRHVQETDELSAERFPDGETVVLTISIEEQ